jgi:hypothetical protein
MGSLRSVDYPWFKLVQTAQVSCQKAPHERLPSSAVSSDSLLDCQVNEASHRPQITLKKGLPDMQPFIAGGFTFEWTGSRTWGMGITTHKFKCKEMTGCYLDLQEKDGRFRWFFCKNGR